VSKFRREPCSAEAVVDLLLRACLRAVSDRGQRLLLHWWCRGIEERVLRNVRGNLAIAQEVGDEPGGAMPWLTALIAEELAKGQP
jgi:hypothetical protein